MTSAPMATGNKAGKETRVDVLVYGLWERETGCVLDTQVTNTDCKSYSDLSLSKVLEKAAKAKKDKYLPPCLSRRRSFMHLVYSVDRMACKEEKSFERRIASLLAGKWNRPYSKMVWYVRGRMGLTIIRHTTMLLHGLDPNCGEDSEAA